MKKCVICGEAKTRLVGSGYPGYVEETSFDILACEQCNTHFIDPIQVDQRLYELVYSDTSIPGYDRYFAYASAVKLQKNPLEFLAQAECTYYAVQSSLKDKPAQRILEVGCGYGYLTYALNQAGHKTVGIDLSHKAITFAQQNLGDCFFEATLESFAKKNEGGEQFDFIIATELIEHLSDPVAFVATCTGLLKKNGAILFTTPNKDYFAKTSVWRTDMPPIHTVWLSHRSFQKIAEQFQLDLAFVGFGNYACKSENKLFHYFLTQREHRPQPVLTKTGAARAGRNSATESPLKKTLRYFVQDFPPVVKVSNFLYQLLKLNNQEYPQLGVILTKK